MPKKMPKTYKGKSTRLGGGGQFQMMKDAIMKTGKSAESAAAITAAAGMKKYGKAKMAKMAAAGRKRAAKKK
ncbi:MAG: hypothetical protein ACM3TR_09855 [Caulobacteraceae bacterium]